MKQYLIYSTLSNANLYVNHEAGGADLMSPRGDGVLIEGGANMMTERGDIPPGTVTTITEAQLDYCRENELFKLHEKNGFLIVAEAGAMKPADVEVVAADMEGRDQSAPLVDGDFPASDPQPSAAPAAPSRRRA